MKTDEQFENIVRLSDIRTEKLGASSPFGPLNPASTTLLAQETHRAYQEARLTELLNSLEREIAELSIRSCEVLNIFLSDTKHLVMHTDSFSNTDTTDSI